MKIQVTGNINEYYVQTLCMLFFPGVKFSKTEAAESDGLSVEIVVKTMELGAEATVSLQTEKGSAVYTHYEEGKPESKVSVEQIACGKAFFEVGKKLTGITPSWGILTGVRPAKLAITGLMDGKSKKEVRDFLTSEYLVSPKKASLVTEIASIENVSKEEIIYVGDSLTKDIYMAIQAGVTSVWMNPQKEKNDYYQKLIDITSWTEEDFKREKKLKETISNNNLSPDFEISEFSSLVKIIESFES